MGAGRFDAGRNVGAATVGALGALKGDRAGVVPLITGAEVDLEPLETGVLDVVPLITGAEVDLGELKGEAADVFPRIAGADVLGALKGEAADVFPRIAGAEGGFIPKPIFIGPELGGLYVLRFVAGLN
jgi:hypothetical protein